MTGLSTGPRDAQPGDRLPVFERHADFESWNRYAAVNDEFVPIHMDDEAGRRAGHETAIGMGNLGVAQIHCLLRTWLGDGGGRIEAVAIQFRSPAVRGRDNRATGTVTSVAPSRSCEDGPVRTISLDVWVEDDIGTVLTRGTARVSIADDAAPDDG